jgi:curved DNA-binding protein CbpA
MTTEPIDCYAILGLPRDATQAHISAAYRTLLRRYHPDTRTPADSSPDEISDAALQHVLTAYTVLHDPARRLEYDEQTTPRTPSARRPAPPIRPSRTHPFDDPPLRAGPVHWTP